VPKKGASGDFDVSDDEDEYESEPDLDYLLAEGESQEHDGFDAFDENTWDAALAPASRTPWYRSRRAQTLLLASGAALSAIVVSVVLLAFQGSPVSHNPVPVPTTTPVTTALASMTSQAPQPPPPPPPPPPPQPPAVQQAPVYQRPVPPPRQTKDPEINVTRPPMSFPSRPHRPKSQP
jgi:hypothetical protein